MSEIDYVVSSLKVKETSVINLEDLYQVMKSWLSNQGYIIGESDYADNDKKHVQIIWTAFKDLDDYARSIIEVRLTGKNMENVNVRHKRLQKGSFEIKLSSYVKSDYSDYWEEKATSKLLRGLYDKFVLSSKQAKYSGELKDDTHDFYNEIKSYLKLHLFK